MIETKSTSALEIAVDVYAQRKRWTTPMVITSSADGTKKPVYSGEFATSTNGSSGGPS